MEITYSICLRKVLAIYLATEQLMRILEIRDFMTYVDNKPITHAVHGNADRYSSRGVSAP